jgi:hypothetical protein
MRGRRPILDNRTATSSVALTAADDRISPRWLVIVAWALGTAGLYGLVTFGQAAVIERIASVDVMFGRSLGFWIGAVYLGLPLWGFLPMHPGGWYARRSTVLVIGAVGVVCAAISVVYDALWLASHWVSSVGVPVVASLAVLVIAAVGVLWLAGRPGSAPVIAPQGASEAPEASSVDSGSTST